MTVDPTQESPDPGQGRPGAAAHPERQDAASRARLERAEDIRNTREAVERGGRRNRYWAVAIVLALAVAAGYFGFTVAEIDAIDQGADSGAATGAGAAAGGAALLGVLAVGSLIIALVVRGRRGSTTLTVVSAVLALAVAAVLMLWIHPMVLDG
ncbi:MAG: hypothetical protein ACTHXO_03390 [Actinomycetaceae bacterium]